MPGSPVALETVGNWSWVADEIEAAGIIPRLVHARKARLMMGMLDKTDRLDARRPNRLQRAGTLPTVWLPPGEVRDRRELPRARMVLTRQRTQLKNRLQAMPAKHVLVVDGASPYRDGRTTRGRLDVRFSAHILNCDAVFRLAASAGDGERSRAWGGRHARRRRRDRLRIRLSRSRYKRAVGRGGNGGAEDQAADILRRR